jgi:hypothetical protein
VQRSIVPAILIICCIAVGAVSGLQVQKSRVLRASATVDILEGQRKLVVHLRNDASVLLEAWSVRIEYDLGKSHKTMEVGIDTATSEAEPGEIPDHGPIMPGETRDVQYPVDGEPIKAVVTVQMLMFDDGTVEGDSSWARGMLGRRESDGRALEVWISALNAASGLSAAAARASLGRTLASEAARMHATHGPDPGLSAYQRMQSLLTSSDDVLLSRIAEAKQRFERVRERELRHISRKQ